MNQEQKNAKLIRKLVAHMCEHQTKFWEAQDFDELGITDDEAGAIDLTAVMQFTVLALSQQVDKLSREEWITFCVLVFTEAEKEEIISVNTNQVGDA